MGILKPRRAGALVLMIALVAACSSDSDNAQTTTTAARHGDPVGLSEDEDLYAVPDGIEGLPHGRLLRYQLVEPSAHPDATTYRILYTSTSHAGDTIVVSGLGVVPDTPAPEDGRNIITLVHGTVGSADQCAPSKHPSEPGELTLLRPLVEAGYLIAATDYEGIGTPGVHPYLVGESEGRSGLDAALAVRQLPGADAGDRFGIMGYSQGGHAAMWTAELATAWAPDLELVGTFAGAPPTEIDLVLGARLTGAAAAFEVLVVNGFAQHYGDELDPAGLLSPEGLQYLPIADEVCVGELSGEVAGFGVDAYVEDPDPAWTARAAENNAGTRATASPLLIIHSSADDLVPPVLSQIATQRLCGLGQVVERRTPDLGGHGPAAVASYAEALAWMQDRFAPDGPPPTTTC